MLPILYNNQTKTAALQAGRPEMIETIARAGVVNNIDGLFIETHFDPANAKSDGANMLHLDRLEPLLKTWLSSEKWSIVFNFLMNSCSGHF
jgi:2-dehydro-3-deoxyphosphooctonate aldolase (KDO 8-P synthase)